MKCSSKEPQTEVLEDGERLRFQIWASRDGLIIRRLKYGPPLIPLVAFLAFENPVVPALMTLSAIPFMWLPMAVERFLGLDVVLDGDELTVRGKVGLDTLKLSQFAGAHIYQPVGSHGLVPPPALALETLDGGRLVLFGQLELESVRWLLELFSKRIPPPPSSRPGLKVVRSDSTLEIETRAFPRLPEGGYPLLLACVAACFLPGPARGLFYVIAFGAFFSSFTFLYRFRPWGVTRLRLTHSDFELRVPPFLGNVGRRQGNLPAGLSLCGGRTPCLCSYEGIVARAAFCWVPPARIREIDAAIAAFRESAA